MLEREVTDGSGREQAYPCSLPVRPDSHTTVSKAPRFFSVQVDLFAVLGMTSWHLLSRSEPNVCLARTLRDEVVMDAIRVLRSDEIGLV